MPYDMLVKYNGGLTVLAELGLPQADIREGMALRVYELADDPAAEVEKLQEEAAELERSRDHWREQATTVAAIHETSAEVWPCELSAEEVAALYAGSTARVPANPDGTPMTTYQVAALTRDTVETAERRGRGEMMAAVGEELGMDFQGEWWRLRDALRNLRKLRESVAQLEVTGPSIQVGTFGVVHFCADGPQLIALGHAEEVDQLVTILRRAARPEVASDGE